jgi:drug/metabolite transporter (DMT)-like permease
MSSTPATHPPARGIAFYVWLGVLGQFIWGSYPVAAKRALAEVPKFSLVFVATVAAATMGWWIVRRQDARSGRAILRFLLGERAMWGLALFVVLRSVTNILAIDLTRATWVQLIYLLTPFMVAILGTLFFGERTPRYTYRALLLSSFGAVLVLVTDWGDVMAGFRPQDLLGLAVAGLSMLALATYFQMIRRSARRHITSPMILFQQSVAQALVLFMLTLVTGEDWSAWGDVSASGWLFVLWVIVGVFILGNLLQITAIGRASPALITSLMPLRLVSAIVLGWLILGEELTTVWQWLGAGLVLVTVSGYLWLQSRDAFQSVR